MKIKKLYIVFLYVLLVSLTNNKQLPISIPDAKITSKIVTSVAGVPIVLSFLSEDKDLLLYCSNSYSTTIIEPEINSKTISFHIPSHIYSKRGILNWKLLHKEKVIMKNTITVTSSEKKTIIESYFGPPSIIAGGRDYSMLVVIPTDKYDNPLKSNTEVTINYQFLNKINKNVFYTDYLIAWQNIFSPDKSGRILVNSICNSVSSKEITAEIFPDNAVNFKINNERFHKYADGNQISTFYTSVIRDQFRNIVSDGTHVDFYIEINNKSVLKTSGNTINGIAKAKMIHPEEKDTWRVKAYVHGIAESDQIELQFEKLFDDFSVDFSDNKRTISVGTLKSFMDQLVPDGFSVQLTLLKENKIIDVKKELSLKGKVRFILKKDFYENGNYTLIIKTGGNTKTFNNILLQN